MGNEKHSEGLQNMHAQLGVYGRNSINGQVKEIIMNELHGAQQSNEKLDPLVSLT